jgi:hypothetical protein
LLRARVPENAETSPSARAAFRLTCLLVALGLGGAEASAQTCDTAALDALAGARRARSALNDEAAFRAIVAGRDASIVADDQQHQVEDGWTTQAYIVDLVTSVDGYRLCTSGVDTRASLVGGWFGLGVWAGDRGGDWRLGVSVINGGDSVSPDAFVANDETSVSPDAVGWGTTFWVVDVGLTRWFALGYGQIQDARATFELGRDESGAQVSNAHFVNTDAPARHYVRLGVPALLVQAAVVLDGDDLEVGTLGADEIPIPVLPELNVGAHLRYLDFEDLTVTGLKIGYPLLDDRLRPSLSVAFAWPDARLRALRARVESGVGGSAHLLDGSLLSGPAGWASWGLAAFAEVSRFSSAAVDASGGQPGVGYQLGGAARAGVRGFELELNGFVAQDRAETLVRLPDASGRGELGAGFLVRIGW